MKPYRSIPIQECEEPLIALPKGNFGFFDPHPYEDLNAPYGKASPWMLRKNVLEALLSAQKALEAIETGWKFKLFDAYRPNKVQAFMVDREFAIQAKLSGLNPFELTEAERTLLAPKVFRLWGIPSDDPKTPPPHSTGAAIDLTLQDRFGHEIDMGSPIDENSERSNPDYFINAESPKLQEAHKNRALLFKVMHEKGFEQHPEEWWHFSLGDQAWAYAQQQKRPGTLTCARYGRADLLKG